MTSALRVRPAADEFAPFYAGYVGMVGEGDLLDIVREDTAALASMLASMPESKGGHRYADGKWTVRELLGHMIDAERIFSYRVLRVARGDATPLPGFEENAYAAAAQSDERSVADLAQEMMAVRTSTLLLLESLPDEAWAHRGTASEQPVSVRALAYIIAGHARHHVAILRERYGVAA